MASRVLGRRGIARGTGREEDAASTSQQGLHVRLIDGSQLNFSVLAPHYLYTVLFSTTAGSLH